MLCKPEKCHSSISTSKHQIARSAAGECSNEHPLDPSSKKRYRLRSRGTNTSVACVSRRNTLVDHRSIRGGAQAEKPLSGMNEGTPRAAIRSSLPPRLRFRARSHFMYVPHVSVPCGTAREHARCCVKHGRGRTDTPFAHLSGLACMKPLL